MGPTRRGRGGARRLAPDQRRWQRHNLARVLSRRLPVARPPGPARLRQGPPSSASRTELGSIVNRVESARFRPHIFPAFACHQASPAEDEPRRVHGSRCMSSRLRPVFHPAVAAWFERSFAAPTAAQAQAWPAIKAGRHVLIAAPTGSGKTLAGFLAAIDHLVRQAADGALPDETQVVYVSPLKALSNDIRKNLEAPLSGISAAFREQGLGDLEIRSWVRTGDTPAGERQRMARRPPHIVVTTPESLYILLGSETGRRMLASTRTVIVDEIHALAANKRGSHLA